MGEHHYELVEVDPNRFEADPEMVQLVEALEAPHKEAIETVIGYSKQPLYRYFVVENTIDTMIVDALKWKINVDVVLSNGFRFCPPRVPDETDWCQLLRAICTICYPLSLVFELERLAESSS